MDHANTHRHPASFKDPSGFLFTDQGVLYRQVNTCYSGPYTQLLQSGLYEALSRSGKLIAHREIDQNKLSHPDWFKTLEPEPLPFISYPYEWCFDQLRDAGLLTLSIMKEALSKGMILKDATAFNVQFRQGKPIFIDTLSFESYQPEQPWVAYRQFCQHFLFPLYIEAYTGVSAIGWLRHYLDGIPVSVCASLLPWKCRWNLGVRLHVLLQDAVKKNAGTRTPTVRFTKTKMCRLLDHLEGILRGLKKNRTAESTWSHYYQGTISGKHYLTQKAALVESWLIPYRDGTVLDLGANEGHFSLLAAALGNQVIAADMDPRCIQLLYQKVKERSGLTVTPVVIDLSNPSPPLGFHYRERLDFSSRAKAGVVLALALVHHLVIHKNIPLDLLPGFFTELGPVLIIEFVPREDEKVKDMMAGREAVFLDYTPENFERIFAAHYTLEAREVTPGTSRILYRMTRK